jgi:hypothetical protein
MTNFPNPQFPISSADCAEIESIFIELMRAHESAARGAATLTPPGTPEDLRADWGLQ